jgi:hypothetical protein
LGLSALLASHGRVAKQLPRRIVAVEWCAFLLKLPLWEPKGRPFAVLKVLTLLQGRSIQG